MMSAVIEANGVRLHVIDEGKGAPVVLLHGFPDSSRLWRHQIPALVDAGYRVIAPDQRGFGASDKPEAVDAYALPTLVGDVTAVMDTLGVDRAHVVGHDWGAAVAWGVGMFVPDRVTSLVAMSVGHPSAFSRRSIEQIEKSWYMLLFGMEGLAEEVIQRNDWWFLREWSRRHPEARRWVEDLARPGALTAGLNWYRANVPAARLASDPMELPPVAVDAMGLWSTDDFALVEEQMTASGDYVSGEWRYERIQGASHWMQLDVPGRINELLLDWLDGRNPHP